MKSLKIYSIHLLSLGLLLTNLSIASMGDDPLLTKVMIDKLELSDKDKEGYRTLI
jgi:hypothetical protein